MLAVFSSTLLLLLFSIASPNIGRTSTLYAISNSHSSCLIASPSYPILQLSLPLPIRTSPATAQLLFHFWEKVRPSLRCFSTHLLSFWQSSTFPIYGFCFFRACNFLTQFVADNGSTSLLCLDADCKGSKQIFAALTVGRSVNQPR